MVEEITEIPQAETYRPLHAIEQIPEDHKYSHS